MAKDIVLTAQEIRDRVVFFLLFLTSESCISACSPFADAEKIAYELCRIWFDDIYTPGLSYFESLKGDFSPEAAARFEDAFDVEELVELERFHHFFELRIGMLAKKFKGAATFPQNDSWRNLLRHARQVLALLEPDSAKLQARLEARVRHAAEQGQNLLAPSTWREMQE